MKRLVVALLAIGLVGVIAYGTQVKAQDATRHYVVLARVQGQAIDVVAAVRQAGGVATAVLGEIGVVLADSSEPDFLANLEGASGVLSAAEDVLVQWIPPNERAEPAPEGLPANMERYSPVQWNLKAIHADETAANGDRGNGVARARVAVIDSGVITTHPDLAPNLNLGLSKSFVPGEPGLNPPANVFNHGTHVAGIIAAPINSIGTQGVAPEAEIVAVKVLRATGSGAFSWVISGIDYASGPLVHADVINMSLGATFDRINAGGGGAGPLLSALNRAVNAATARGTLVVSAAGNQGVNLNSRIVSIPAQSGNGMAVAATAPIGWLALGWDGSFDHQASYTNFGQSVVNVSAPGGDSAYPGNENCTANLTPPSPPVTRPCWIFDMVISPGGYGPSGGQTVYRYYWAAGTSMAAPHVSGVAALIVGKYGHMAPEELKAILQQSSFDILKPGADWMGKGRIDALEALRVAGTR